MWSGSRPSYEEKRFETADKRGRLRLVASPDGADGSVTIHQDARVYAGLLDGTETASARTRSRAPCLCARRARQRRSRTASRSTAGDAAKITDMARVALARGQDAEVLVFDLP